MHKCSTCKKDKQNLEFYKDKRRYTGLQSQCISCWKISRAKYRQSSRYKEWKKQHISQEKVKEKRREWMKEDRIKNPEKYKRIGKIKSIKARESGWSKQYAKKRLLIPKHYIDHKMSNSIRKALKRKDKSWRTLVGYSAEDLKVHLESRFTEGMTWELFVSGKIHLDHIIPKSYFKYEKETDEDFIKCWSLQNLQPLWAKDNLKKGNKILGSLQE